MPSPSSYTILGGGISGLACAYRLAVALPKTPITLIEASNRLGGWMQSHKQEGGVIFESGPRTMRPKGVQGWSTIALIAELGLADSLLTVHKSHASAKNRFVYYPDRLNKLPSSLLSLLPALRQPALHGLASAVLKEPFQKACTKADESVDSFFRRRFGPHIAENMVSAMIRGIYAGDSRQLSIRAIFPSLWQMEKKHGSVIKGMLSSSSKNVVEEAKTIEGFKSQLAPGLRKDLEECSVWGLKGGMGALTVKLEEELRRRPNVDIQLGARTSAISFAHTTYTLQLPERKHSTSHLISSIPSSSLATLLPLPNLTANPSVSVGVVNLSYPSPNILPVTGFGYLIPRSTPASQNPHRALGVVFDSDSMPGLLDAPDQTKLSVLLGGHQYTQNDMPDEATLVTQAIDTVERHLGVKTKPNLAVAHQQKDCIPQYGVGHVDRMKELHSALEGKAVSLIGASYDGVGVNDCIWSGLQTADKLVKDGQATGLERMAAIA